MEYRWTDIGRPRCWTIAEGDGLAAEGKMKFELEDQSSGCAR